MLCGCDKGRKLVLCFDRSSLDEVDADADDDNGDGDDNNDGSFIFYPNSHLSRLYMDGDRRLDVRQVDKCLDLNSSTYLPMQ